MNNRGFTLVEMMVAIAIFIVLLMITMETFTTILVQTSKLFKSEESNIEGVVGLEMFRHDLQQAGFGLPYSYDANTPIVYKEAGYAPANLFNDAPGGVPRPIVAGNNSGSAADLNRDGGENYTVLPNTDYLVIKATSVGANNASQKWTYVTYSSSIRAPKKWPGENLKHKVDNIIVLRRTFKDSGYDNQLVYAPSKNPQGMYWVTYNDFGFSTVYSPTQPAERYYLYGINSSSDVARKSGL